MTTAILPVIETSPPKVSSLLTIASDAKTVKGQKYEVQATNDLRKWNLVDTIEGTGLEIVFTDYREALFLRQFYRVKVMN